MSIKTPLNRVRGLGAAKEGVGHFWHQRLTAVALFPLVLWLLYSICGHIGEDYQSARVWIAKPTTAVPFLLLILAGFYHMKLGLQVVIEDYIHKDGTRIALSLLNNFWAFGVGVLCIYSVLSIAFGG